MKWEEVDLKQKRINLTDAKTGDRTVSLGDETVALLEEFSKKGTYVLNGDVPLNESALRRFWTWVKETAQIPEDARPHDFRHTAATYAAQADHNAFALRDFMGHKTIAMTNRYVDRAKNPALAAANSVSSRVATDMKKPTSRKKKIIK